MKIAFKLILILFFLLNSFACQNVFPNPLMSYDAKPSFLAPSSNVMNIDILFDQLRQKKMDYGHLFKNNGWDATIINNDTDLKLLLKNLAYYAIKDRLLFHKIRREICWWLLLTKNPSIWTDKKQNADFSQYLEETLNNLYSHIPIEFRIQANQIKILKTFTRNLSSIFQVIYEKVIHHYHSIFSSEPRIGQRRIIALLKDKFYLTPFVPYLSSFWNQVVGSYTNNELLGILLNDSFIEKNLWLLTNRRDVLTIELNPHLSGYFKDSYIMTINYEDGSNETFILKISRNDIPGLQEVWDQELIASQMISDPTNSLIPTCGLWTHKAVIEEKMNIHLSLRQLVFTWAINAFQPTQSDLDSLAEGMIDVHLAMDHEYAKPLFLIHKDFNLANHVLLDGGLNVGRIGRIDFGKNELSSKPGQLVHVLIRSLARDFNRISNYMIIPQINESQWENIIIRIFLKKGQKKYIISYIQFLENILLQYDHIDFHKELSGAYTQNEILTKIKYAQDLLKSFENSEPENLSDFLNQITIAA